MTAAPGAPALGEGPGEGGELVRWGACFLAILGLHAGVALAVGRLATPEPVRPSELPAVVMIDMAPPPPAAPAAPPAENPPSEAEPEAAAPDPVPTAEPDVIPEPEPEPIVEPPPPVQEVMKPEPVERKAEVVLPQAPPKVRPPPPKPKPKPKIVERKPPKQVQASIRAEARVARRPPAQASSAETNAAQPSVSRGASAASSASWHSQIVAFLQRNLRYPPGSRSGGTAAVSFVMNRQGRVLSASLARSSGSSELDAAAVELLRRGGLPPPPPELPGGSFPFTIPIRFNAR